MPGEQIGQNLTQTVIGRPLIDKLRASADPNAVYDVIIDPNLDFSGGREKASARIRELIVASKNAGDPDPKVRSDTAHPYVFAKISGRAILEIVTKDGLQTALAASPVESVQGKQRLSSGDRAIYRIWEDMEVRAFLTNSVATVKADAARMAFSADGKDIVWAIIDSGIDQTHPHFKEFANLQLSPPLAHKDLTGDGDSPLTDELGHGTHVAGILVGAMEAEQGPKAVIRTRDPERAARLPVWCARSAQHLGDGAEVPVDEPEGAGE